jgi:hypothetical protein
MMAGKLSWVEGCVARIPHYRLNQGNEAGAQRPRLVRIVEQLTKKGVGLAHARAGDEYGRVAGTSISRSKPSMIPTV